MNTKCDKNCINKACELNGNPGQECRQGCAPQDENSMPPGGIRSRFAADLLGRQGIIAQQAFDKKIDRLSLLLHSCCGPCSSSVIERLAGEFNITVFYYNPCITDEEEYKRRRAAQAEFIRKFNAERIDLPDINLIEGAYEPGAFLEAAQGHEEDPEGGQRCSICFRQRLEKAAETAAFQGFDLFGTTLTVSPHKNYEIISAIGKDIAAKYGVGFLDRDFKKQDGFKRSIELSKKYGLYRQNYCGCVYSER